MMRPRDMHIDVYVERLERDLAVARADAARMRAALEAADLYARAGLMLQQAVGCMDGPLMEQFELFMPWEMACKHHGEYIEARAALEPSQ